MQAREWIATGRILRALWMSSINDWNDEKRWDRHFGDSLPLNKFQIEKAAKIKGRQTLHNNIRMMKRDGIDWIRVVKREKGKRGYVEFYELTEEGKRRTADLNPDLTDEIRKRMGPKFEELTERRKQASLAAFQYNIKVAEAVLARGKAEPNWFFRMELRADENGKISWKVSSGFPVQKAPESRQLSESEIERLLSAGGGKLDISNLTPQQKTLLDSLEPRPSL